MRTQPLYSELRTLYETSADAPNTFRVSIKLKDRIDGARLQTAVEKTMARYPYFKVRVTCEAGKLYFEENPAPFPVIHTDQRIALGDPQTSDHLMAISYWEDQLNIDVFHGLTDGSGIAPLMKTLLYYYCSDYYNAPLSSEGIRLSEEAVS